MVWNDEKDKIMLRQMAAEGVMDKKPKSRDRGASWQKVVNNLNVLPQFEVSQKSRSLQAPIKKNTKLNGKGGEMYRWRGRRAKLTGEFIGGINRHGGRCRAKSNR